LPTEAGAGDAREKLIRAACDEAAGTRPADLIQTDHEFSKVRLERIARLGAAMANLIEVDANLTPDRRVRIAGTAASMLRSAVEALPDSVDPPSDAFQRVSDTLASLYSTWAVTLESPIHVQDAAEWLDRARRMRLAVHLGEVAESRVMAGSWDDAQRTLDQAIANAPEAQYYRFSAAILAAVRRDSGAYHHHCQALLRSSARSECLSIRERCAKACLLCGLPAADLEAACKVAESVVLEESNRKLFAWHFFVEMLAQYRQSHYERALALGDRVEAIAEDWEEGKALAYAVCAMAEQRLGRQEQAPATLTKAVQLLQRLRLGSSTWISADWWHDALAVEVLVREASEAMRGG